jgi:DNA-binding NarL/FixJ family response regulator
MRLVTVVGDEKANPEKLRSRLAGIVDIHFEPLESQRRRSPALSAAFDINLNNEPRLQRLKEWLKRKPANAKAIFLTEKSSHLQQTRAYALGATDILYRPVDFVVTSAT